MQKDSTHQTDLKIVALLTVMLVCLVAMIVLLLHDASDAESRMQPMLSANAAMLHSEPTPNAAPAAADGMPARPITPEENWVADESSQGMLPEAAH